MATKTNTNTNPTTTTTTNPVDRAIATLATLSGDALIIALTKAGMPYAGKALVGRTVGSGKQSKTVKAVQISPADWDQAQFARLCDALHLSRANPYNAETGCFEPWAVETGGKAEVSPAAYAASIRAEWSSISAEFASLCLTDSHLGSLKGKFPSGYALIQAARFYPTLTGETLAAALKTHTGKKGKTANPRPVNK